MHHAAGAYVLTFPGGGFGFNTEPEETPESLRAFGRQMSQFFNDPRITVDGQMVPVGPSAWVDPEPFEYEIPETNIFGGYPARPVTAHFSGWFVMLEPLELGEHTIVLADDSIDPVKDADGNVHYAESTATATHEITVEGDGSETADDEAEAADDEAATD